MIYFVVAQKNEDGKWEVIGQQPFEFVNMADDLIAELTDDPKYSQVELARVLTDEDNPDREEWLSQDKHEPSEEISKIQEKRTENGIATYKCDQKTKDIVFKKIISWLIKGKINSGDIITDWVGTPTNGPYADITKILAEMVDDIIEFDIKHEDEI